MTEKKSELCITCCNHWSYTGIGWTLGIESCALSIIDAMEMADREPHVKTCINQDARAYELIARTYPEIANKLKKYLANGRVELIGGSYGQPLGTMFSGESNIRQVVVGKQAILDALDYEVVTFLEQEEFSHPQMPQILSGAGYRYASLHQVDTWGAAGVPLIELNAFHWKGLDGTAILTIPKTTLRKITGATVGSTTVKHVDADRFKELSPLGKPILFCWEEFGWEEPERPAYLTKPKKYKDFAEQFAAEFVTLGGYLEKYGKDAKETRFLNMDAWNKLLAWGIGGDQLRVFDRKIEALLLAAEKFDAIASALGAPSRSDSLAQAWKDLLIAQSHDVALCEYTRWQGLRTATADRIEDYHNLTWGNIGYNHLESAQKQGESVLDDALGAIANSQGEKGKQAITVFNPFEWKRTGLVRMKSSIPLSADATSLQVRDHSGAAIPSQIIKNEMDATGTLIRPDILFIAEAVPSLGFKVYNMELAAEDARSLQTDLQVHPENLVLENKYLTVRIDPFTGAIASLIDKSENREMFASAWPQLTGRGETEAWPGKQISGHSRQELNEWSEFDSTKSKAEIQWIEKGPVRATVKAIHAWPLMKFETSVSLTAGQKWVEITSRILATIPPLLNERQTSGWPLFKSNIEQGYWLSFAPAFKLHSVMRDIPFGIEAASRDYFHALTFADFIGGDAGLMLMHPGTQYFKCHPDGRISNLAMREWGSFWDGEFGWPRYAEYRHALMPHGMEFTNADRLRASSEFNQSLLGRPGRPSGKEQNSFGNVTPDNVRISAFRKKSNEGYELRIAEVQGNAADVLVELHLPFTEVWETNLLGAKAGSISCTGGCFGFEIKPWQVRTFELKP